NALSAWAPEAQLADQPPAGRIEPGHDRRVRRGDPVPERVCAPRRRYPCGIEQVFDAIGNSVQRSAVLSPGNLLVRLAPRDERPLLVQRDDGAKFGLELLDASEIDPRQALGR